jgi:hypothetical protein
MKTITATKTMAALAVLAMAFPVSGSAAEGVWGASHACNVTSPEKGDAPRVTLTGTRKGDVGGKVADAARFRIFNIPKLSDKKNDAFAGTVAEIPGFATWDGIKAEGKQEKSGYALYIPLPGLAAVMGPLEGGRSLKVTVQAKDGPQTFEIDLTGSAKAVASFRACAT